MLYDDTVTWRVWAAKKAHQPPLPCSQVLNQRLGEGHPDRKPRRAVVLGRMRSELREWPAVYPAFALQATRGSSSLEDQTSSFSTHENTVLFYGATQSWVACQKRWETDDSGGLEHQTSAPLIRHSPHNALYKSLWMNEWAASAHQHELPARINFVYIADTLSLKTVSKYTSELENLKQQTSQ